MHLPNVSIRHWIINGSICNSSDDCASTSLPKSDIGMQQSNVTATKQHKYFVLICYERCSLLQHRMYALYYVWEKDKDLQLLNEKSNKKAINAINAQWNAINDQCIVCNFGFLLLNCFMGIANISFYFIIYMHYFDEVIL